MSIVQFLRTLWAYKVLVLVSVLVCFALATAVVQLVPPRYQAQSRVMLDVIKPDPVTGEVISSSFLRAYTKTQIEMVKDPQVAKMVVKDLGLQKDAKLQRAYRERGASDMDFDTWAAQVITRGASADLIMGSNILEITYSSNSPERAKAVADGLLKAYMDKTLQTRRETARRNAEWYEGQAEKIKTILFAAENAKAAYERENGIVLQADKSDLESARLAALASQGAAPVITSPMAATSPSAGMLAQLDAEIAEASKTLGPNHPQLQQMRARRTVLAQQVTEERNTAGAAAGAALSAARATSSMLEEQKAKVMAQSGKVERLRLMQNEIDLRREQYGKAVTRAAQLRQEADASEAGVTPLASATTPQSPVFPKKGLIMSVSVPAGALLGIVIALMFEIIGRRVRSAEDLGAAIGAPVLAVIRNPNARKGRRAGWLDAFGPAFRRGPARAVRA